jgi:hypothetical protein
LMSIELLGPPKINPFLPDIIESIVLKNANKLKK